MRTSANERYASPLRYPGGKGSFTALLRAIIAENFAGNQPVYAEPFAGGAGAALRLLHSGDISKAVLNDADPRIYSFWRAVTKYNTRFCERVQTVPLTIAEWKRQKEICNRPKTHKLFDVGFSTFFLNRCNRSGVIRSAGPIGGFEQNATYGIDARFNRETLIDRIKAIGDAGDAIEVKNLDALEFLSTWLPKGFKRSEIFVYLDPPYVDQGGRLYMNRYQPRDHQLLAKYLKRQKVLRWMVSYDDGDLVRKLYNGCAMHSVNTWYSLQNRVKETELIFTPTYLSIPISKT